ncbi:MAG: helix-turn-helix domain-containing protein [Candidatus ainarchaeum sp.]|nr:helix-turn-helix domain-containing protein [Candidatus ainarchaeum sp.]
MDNLIIKIGADKRKELKEVFDNPQKAKKNTHTLFLDSTEDLYKILSPKRFELLRYLIKHQAEKQTISEIADELKRKQEAISRDANLLKKYDLIEKIKEKQMIYLKALYTSLDIQLAST